MECENSEVQIRLPSFLMEITSKKIERRRNAVLTKTKGFYDSGIIICGADRFVNLPAHKKLKAWIIKCIKMDKISKSEIFRGDIQKRKSENVPDAD